MTDKEAKDKRFTVKPAQLLTQVAAANYLNVSRVTINRLVKDGNLKTTDQGGKKYYRVSELDKAKAHVGAYAGKRGRPSDFERAFDVNAREIALAEQTELAEKLLEGMAIDPSMGIEEGQKHLRKQIMVLASHNKVVQELFAMLRSPVGNERMTALKMIFSIVLPQQKEVKHEPGQEWKETLGAMEDLREQVRGDISRLLGPPPTVVDGEIVEQPKLEYLPEFET